MITKYQMWRITRERRKLSDELDLIHMAMHYTDKRKTEIVGQLRELSKVEHDAGLAYCNGPARRDHSGLPYLIGLSSLGVLVAVGGCWCGLGC